MRKQCADALHFETHAGQSLIVNLSAVLFELVPRYNIAPSQNVLAITERDGEREASFYQWGLVPAWSAEHHEGFINARAETLQEKPSFSESFQRRRCLIPADGFYEWKTIGQVEAALLLSNEGRSAVCFCRHLGPVAGRRQGDHLVRDHHHHTE